MDTVYTVKYNRNQLLVLLPEGSPFSQNTAFMFLCEKTKMPEMGENADDPCLFKHPKTNSVCQLICHRISAQTTFLL